MKHTLLTHKNPGGILDHGDHTIPPSRLKYPFAFDEFPYTPEDEPAFPTHFTNKKYTDDQAAAARTDYVGLTPIFYNLMVPMTWTGWFIAPYIPANARWVEIVHVNVSPTNHILIGSRSRWVVYNRWVGVAPLKQVTWTTRTYITGFIVVFASQLPARFYLVGYWT